MKKLAVAFLSSLLFSKPALADIKLPYLFSSHAVLQRNAPLKIWGWASPGESVTVTFRNQTKSATADAAGKWTTQLAPEGEGGPYTLTVSNGKQTIKLDDLMVGEVWVCSGQSNMEWILADAQNGKEEIAAADYPGIRQFVVSKKVAYSPQAMTDSAAWQVCSPSTASRFSAVAYFFARKLYNELKVPIGLINSSWGGTNAEAWASADAMGLSPDFAKAITDAPKSAEDYALIVRKRNSELLQKFGGALPQEKESVWMDAAYNDAAWPTLDVTKYWEEQGLQSFDGSVWYRTVVSLTPQQAAAKATLRLGPIDDNDQTFVNGKQIGATAQYNADRAYSIPAGLLHAGANVILVKAIDDQGNGGFYGNAPRSLNFDGATALTLPSKWKARIGNSAASKPGPNELPASLYNGMINPLINYAIRGALWYQGEANVDRAKQYETLFPLLITDWRKKWNQGNFPFYFVQLSSYDPAHKPQGSQSPWAELRDAQRKTLSLPATGMAVTTDIGARDDIHPRNKQDVGLRLALIALHDTYGKAIVAMGPVIKSAVQSSNTLIIGFGNAASGLKTKDGGGEVSSLELVDADGKIIPVPGAIAKNGVLVSVPAGVKATAVRYGWKDDAGDANLQNADGLPAVPFQYSLTNKK